ncbi:MAG: Uma2 family endonuclease [Anaerolineae bacterium]
MTTQPQVKLLTAEEFSALPDDGNHYDLVRGELIKVGRPKPEHGELQATLTYFVVGHVRLNALGKVYTEAGFHITHDPDTVYGPDVAFVAKERATERDDRGYFAFAPELAVEILSPNDSISSTLDKANDYLSAGTRLVWFIYPRRKVVYVCRAATSIEIISIEDVLDGGDVLPNFSLPLRELFKGMDD